MAETSSLLNSEKLNQKQQQGQDEARKRFRHAATTSVLILLGLWFGALVLGAWHHDGRVPETKQEKLQLQQRISLQWFDRMFKKAGGLILFFIWSLRTAIKHVIHGRRNTLSTRPGIHSEHVWLPGFVYLGQAGLRALVYHAHQAGYFWLHPIEWYDALFGQVSVPHDAPDIMSDHVLLASTVLTGLACEVALALASRAIHTQQSSSKFMLVTFTAAAFVLALLVCGEMYFTARYFHSPTETLTAAVFGIALFQAPLLYYILSVLWSPME